MNGLPPMKEVKSSNLEAVGHQGTRLFVRFKGGGIYSYAGVPPEVYHELAAAESPGSVFRAKVRGQYKHTLHDQ